MNASHPIWFINVNNYKKIAKFSERSTNLEKNKIFVLKGVKILRARQGSLLAPQTTTSIHNTVHTTFHIIPLNKMNGFHCVMCSYLSLLSLSFSPFPCISCGGHPNLASELK